VTEKLYFHIWIAHKALQSITILWIILFPQCGKKIIAHDRERDQGMIHHTFIYQNSRELRKRARKKTKERIKTVSLHLFQAWIIERMRTLLGHSCLHMSPSHFLQRVVGQGLVSSLACKVCDSKEAAGDIISCLLWQALKEPCMKTRGCEQPSHTLRVVISNSFFFSTSIDPWFYHLSIFIQGRPNGKWDLKQKLREIFFFFYFKGKSDMWGLLSTFVTFFTLKNL